MEEWKERGTEGRSEKKVGSTDGRTVEWKDGSTEGKKGVGKEGLEGNRAGRMKK